MYMVSVRKEGMERAVQLLTQLITLLTTSCSHDGDGLPQNNYVNTVGTTGQLKLCNEIKWI